MKATNKKSLLTICLSLAIIPLIGFAVCRDGKETSMLRKNIEALADNENDQDTSTKGCIEIRGYCFGLKNIRIVPEYQNEYE